MHCGVPDLRQHVFACFHPRRLNSANGVFDKQTASTVLIAHDNRLPIAHSLLFVLWLIIPSSRE